MYLSGNGLTELMIIYVRFSCWYMQFKLIFDIKQWIFPGPIWELKRGGFSSPQTGLEFPVIGVHHTLLFSVMLDHNAFNYFCNN